MRIKAGQGYGRLQSRSNFMYYPGFGLERLKVPETPQIPIFELKPSPIPAAILPT
jgi:hypothetical protein